LLGLMLLLPKLGLVGWFLQHIIEYVVRTNFLMSIGDAISNKLMKKTYTSLPIKVITKTSNYDESNFNDILQLFITIKSMGKKSKIISFVALGLVILLFLPIVLNSIIQNSESVQEEVAATFASGFAKSAYTNAAIAATYREGEITEEDIQGALKDIVDTTDTMVVSYDKVGNVKVEIEDGGVAYSCVNLGGFGTGKCGEAVLSKIYYVTE